MSAPRLAATRVDSSGSWRVWWSGRGSVALILLVSLLLTLLTMTWCYFVKVRCGGAPFFPDGRSHHFPVGDPHAVIPCYSDLMYLWVGRDINNHVFPFIHGGINADGQLFGGSVEYPVLSGVLMYLGAIGAHTDTGFFMHSVLLLAPFGFAITIMLALMTRWRSLLWAATPPLVLYAFHNWELPVVATSVGAIGVMALGATTSRRTGRRRMSVRTSAILAAVLLAIGFCLKLYPGFFVLPLAGYVLTRGPDDTSAVSRRVLDKVGAAWVVVAAAATVIVVEAPFMLLGYRGWRAALQFQGKRKADVDTNSIWYWGFRYLLGGTQDDRYNSLVGIGSPALILCAFVVAIFLGWRRYQQIGVFPWIGVSAAMLAGFMVFHKVHSPQYTLWILPFFVLLRVRWPVIVAYLLADLCLDLTIFRLFAIYSSHSPMQWWVIGGVNLGVWVHAVLLVYLIGAFVRAPLSNPVSLSMVRNTTGKSVEPPSGPPGTSAVVSAAT